MQMFRVSYASAWGRLVIPGFGQCRALLIRVWGTSFALNGISRDVADSGQDESARLVLVLCSRRVDVWGYGMWISRTIYRVAIEFSESQMAVIGC